MRILLLIAPKDYGGGGKLSGGGGRGQDPSVGQDPGRPVGREHGNGMGCCRQSGLTEEARAGGWSGRAGRQAAGVISSFPASVSLLSPLPVSPLVSPQRRLFNWSELSFGRRLRAPWLLSCPCPLPPLQGAA